MTPPPLERHRMPAEYCGGWTRRFDGRNTKIITAAFLDNYNHVVGVVRNDSSLQRNVGTLKQEAAAGGTTRAGGGAVFNEGDVLMPKIANVRMLAEPADGSKALATLARGEELVVIGAVKDGFVHVQSAGRGGRGLRGAARSCGAIGMGT